MIDQNIKKDIKYIALDSLFFNIICILITVIMTLSTIINSEYVYI